MKLTTPLVILVAVLIVLSASSFFVLTAHHPGPTTTDSATTTNFLSQPVGDILIPQIESSSSGGEANLPLNVSQGQTISLGVSVYLETDANISMQFKVLVSPASYSTASAIRATFSPENMTASYAQNASTTMTIYVPSTAPIGAYTAVISVQDLDTPSFVWGTNIQINVGK